MKQTIVLTGLILISLSSCRKDRTCTCTDSSGTTLGTANYINVKRSEANTFCSASQSQYQSTNPGATCSVR